MLNLIQIIKIKTIKKNKINIQIPLKYKLNKINHIYLVSKIISNILVLKKQLKIDIRLVKDIRDNVEIIGSYLNKEIMKNSRGIKGLIKKLMHPVERRKNFRRKKILLKNINNYNIKKENKIPTWLKNTYVKSIK